MSNRRWGFIIMAALLLLLTACSSGGQVMDGEDMVRSYTQISQEEAKPDNLEGTVPAPADALVGEFDFSAERVLLNSGWEMPIIGTGTWKDCSPYHPPLASAGRVYCHTGLIESGSYRGEL